MSSFSINRVVLVGRLTRDPEMRPLRSGSSVCGLRMACNSVRRDADGEFQEKPNYFEVNVFGASAENVKRYTHKGSRVGVDGHLEWREWDTIDQQKRQAVSVTADTVLFLDSPRGSDDREPGDVDPRDEIDEASASAFVGVGADGEEGELGF